MGGSCYDEARTRSIVRSGNEITITYTVQAIPPLPCGLSPVLFLNVYIGTFAPGTYTVRTIGDYHGTFPTDNSSRFTVLPAPSTAVEYYSPARDHYFLTSAPDEIDLLNRGVIAGWQPTGERFGAFVMDDATLLTSPTTGIAPVCRFYGRPEAGLDSHFFSASPTECQEVQQTFGASWLLETARAFGVVLPDAVSGAYAVGTEAVYRVYNNRRDANHRYTTSLAIRDSMMSAGWIAEGYGPQAVAMCAAVRS